MFVYIYQYKCIDPSEFEMLVPFEILPMPPEMITVSSTVTQNSYAKNRYDYAPIIKKVLASSYMNYPFHLIIETYSKEIVENVLLGNQLNYILLLEKPNTVVFKVVIEDEKDLLTMLPTLYTSGTNSLFNLMTEFDEIVCINDNQIRIDLSQNPASKSLCFLYDLQELCFLGYDEPQDRAFIKTNFLQGSEIVDDLEIEL